jgi:hypothetical protein
MEEFLINARFTLGVRANVQPKSRILIGVKVEISPKGLTAFIFVGDFIAKLRSVTATLRK